MHPIYTRTCMYSTLKTFLNIAEAQFKKLLNYDVCVVYNDVQKDKKQPEIQTVSKFMLLLSRYL